MDFHFYHKNYCGVYKIQKPDNLSITRLFFCGGRTILILETSADSNSTLSTSLFTLIYSESLILL